MKLVLIDGNSLVNRAFYAMPSLLDSKGRSTGGVYGFMSMLNKLIINEKPTHIAVAFDLKDPTFRHEKYSDYKALRKPMPEELAEQIPLLKELLKALKITYIEKKGYEADDILGTLSKKFDMPTIIVSGDKDCLQLIDKTTTVFYTRRGITDVVEYTVEKLLEEGLTPSQVTDLKGLMGDSSDNIPGVPGVGEKTARKLIGDYGDLDGIYNNLDDIKGKLKEKLQDNKDMAYFSKELATIWLEVPCIVEPEDIELKYPFSSDAENMLIGFDFRSLVGRFEFEKSKPEINLEGITINITSRNQLDEVLQNNSDKPRFAYRIGKELHFAFDSDCEYRIIFVDDLLSEGIDYDYTLSKILPIITDPNKKIITFDVKSDYHAFSNELDKKCYDCEDIMLMEYVLNPGTNWNSIEELLKFYGYSGERPSAEMLKLYDDLILNLKDKELLGVYYDIEKPLVNVLYNIEITGFNVDKSVLSELEKKYSEELSTLTDEIYRLAGHTFNINSPKQLGIVLFDELNLPTDKKKSTNADKLQFLQNKHPIIPYLLRYRQLSKLLSTYITGLKIDTDGRLRTIFKQAVTSTGRLSSTEPNLQNIPVRHADGREIRRAFIASEGNILVTADYSQIELRLMAHYSKDKGLIKAYNDNLDIHTATASKVFGVSEIEVTSEMRRRAKAVNFGIIYGISDFGLSDNIGTSVAEAKQFIEKYFNNYPAVKEYMDNIKETAHKQGYVKTLFGRIRYIPELKSSNYNVRSYGERAAMNMPLQGSASDIIKIAMIRVYNALLSAGLKAKIVLQVHDELIIDTPNNEVDKVKCILKNEMENVIKLAVPLVADVSCGKNWVDAK